MERSISALLSFRSMYAQGLQSSNDLRGQGAVSDLAESCWLCRPVSLMSFADGWWHVSNVAGQNATCEPAGWYLVLHHVQVEGNCRHSLRLSDHVGAVDGQVSIAASIGRLHDFQVNKNVPAAPELRRRHLSRCKPVNVPAISRRETLSDSVTCGSWPR